MANFISFILKNGKKKKPLKKKALAKSIFVAKFHNLANFSFVKWEKKHQMTNCDFKGFFGHLLKYK